MDTNYFKDMKIVDERLIALEEKVDKLAEIIIQILEIIRNKSTN